MSTILPGWSLPDCPVPPEWQIEWAALCAQYAWLRELADTPQDPQYHAEGDVLTHTRMVVEALVALPPWQALPLPLRSVLFLAALLHDVAKPICTEVDSAGRITSPHHARKGETRARVLLWRDAGQFNQIPFILREQVTKLVRHHGLPLWFMEKLSPERAVVAASQVIRLDLVALLAEADVRGRICADQAELLERVDLFRQYAAELDCLDRPRAFPSEHARFVYFQNSAAPLHYAAYDDTRFEVILMCGLPASGKDTWIQQHAQNLPVIALDDLRAELRIEPSEHPGPVVRAAKQRARALLQQRQPFVWNATNITRRLRRQLISFFTDYGARVRIVCIVAPFDTIRQRNRARRDPVPEKVMLRMLEAFELPDVTEAHSVAYSGDLSAQQAVP